MIKIRFSLGNVFLNSYVDRSTWNRSASGRLSAFNSDSYFYPYWNKYLRNDDVFKDLTSSTGDLRYVMYSRNPDRGASTLFRNPDFIKSASASGPGFAITANTTVTGEAGYLYINPSASGFFGWFFPFLKSMIFKLSLYSIFSLTSDLNNIYYMGLGSWYMRSLSYQHNKSYNCITRVPYSGTTALQFIKDKLTYISSVALLDDNNTVLAVGKLSRPIQKMNFLPMSFKLRFFS